MYLEVDLPGVESALSGGIYQTTGYATSDARRPYTSRHGTRAYLLLDPQPCCSRSHIVDWYHWMYTYSVRTVLETGTY